MAARDLPLDRLASRLRAAGSPVSVATLSYWRAGRSVPTRGNSVRAVETLERILEVPPGYLTGALPGQTATRWNPLPVLPHPGVVRQVVEDELGLTLNRRLTTVTHHESLVVNADGQQEASLVSQLLRSEVGGVADHFVVLHQEAAPAGVPELQALTGCETGRVFAYPQLRLAVVQLRLPRTFGRGDLLALSYRIRWVPTEDLVTARGLPCPVEYLTMEVTFRGAPPSRVLARMQAAQGSQPRTETDLSPAPFVQHVLTEADPGLHSLTWQW